MNGMGHKSGTLYYFREKIYINSKEKNKSYHRREMLVEAMLMSENHLVRLHVVVELWIRSCFLKRAK